MKIPLAYTWRSLWTRKVTTILTLSGISLVVFVFAAVLMLAHGVEKTLADTGSDDNVIVLRRAANSELVSQIGRDAANIIDAQPEISALPGGKPLASNEVFVVINLLKKESNDMGNVSVRGISPEAFQMREHVKISAGRPFQFGTHEIIIGKNIATRFQGTEIGKLVLFGGDSWTIVGQFDDDGSGFESEIWGDVEQLMPAFGRPVFSSITFRLRNPDDFQAVKAHLENDPRTQYVELKHEKTYYEEQSAMMANFIRVLGLIVTIIFSVGAIIGAMITMYAAVANRTVEVGTLRAVGFQRRSVLGAYLIESLLLATVGGGIGIALASLMSFIRISTVNFGTFSELGFGFSLSERIIFDAILFSVIMGFIGGFLPSVRASRLNIVNALRSS